jgi:hypothetical protein
VRSLPEHSKTTRGQSCMGNQHMEKGTHYCPVSHRVRSEFRCLASHTTCLPTSRKIQSVFALSDGSGLAVTVARYETPAHTDIDKVSIPDPETHSRCQLLTAWPWNSYVLIKGWCDSGSPIASVVPNWRRCFLHLPQGPCFSLQS